MGLDKTEMERLAYIKNLHQLGVELSQKPAPFNTVSILTFHDSIEMFLHFSFQYVDGKENDPDFMEYWWLIERERQIELTQKESIRALNKDRNALKHDFRRPAADEVESHRAIVKRFFEENVPKVFGVDYSEIELAHLIQFEECKDLLLQARSELKDGNTRQAMISADDAFRDMMREFEERASSQLGYSPYPTPSYNARIRTRGYSGEVEEMARDVSRLSDEIYEDLKMMSLDIDYLDYAHFNH